MRLVMKKAKRPGEVTTGEAAEILSSHEATMRIWAQEFIASGVHSRISYARQDWRGRYYLKLSEISAIRRIGRSVGKL